ncbi:MAG TPA: histidine kinase dimerization/phospho-acceptor domain-containing protein, partial [Polyangiaceae bacterium]|nr:histidine kinase dimerization/phospho-acceptor domain-containing protein [Polyangiaceae bacterium]
MDTLTLVDEWLAGFFACAAIHYGIHWWYSRKEQLFLALAILCIAYAAFCLQIVSYFRATTFAETQSTLDRFVSIGLLSHALALDFFARVGARRDRSFRILVTGLLGVLALSNQWVPLRGTVLELKTLLEANGAKSTIPVRTPPGVSLALLYLAVLLVYGYGLFVARALWKRARAGALLIATASAGILAGAAVGFLIDFEGVRAAYVGAWPHAIFVLCAALFLARQYSARGIELRAHRDRLEELVAVRTRELTEAKNDADRANGAKTRFLAQISHEIRDPMNVILAHAQSLERDYGLLQAQRRKIEIIRASGKHLLSLINDLLEISKIEAGHPELVESPFEPRVTLLAVEQMFGAEAAARGIALTTSCAPDLPRELLGDGAKVKQI